MEYDAVKDSGERQEWQTVSVRDTRHGKDINHVVHLIPNEREFTIEG
jgi:hypothetical protein